ncbi:DNA polymerase V [Modicisalibacter xianhensis]|uniref:DNA polymerase V n=1 Tax=Modicisalibacter xianhensis TaxID=442341 RepID=A0A1I2ZY71_9GAMM|nr:DNA polymerase V [Halomonas xianhensis]
MVSFGIFDDDLLTRRRALDPRPGDILIDLVDGELACKRLGTSDSCTALMSGNSDYASTLLDGCVVAV